MNENYECQGKSVISVRILVNPNDPDKRTYSNEIVIEREKI